MSSQVLVSRHQLCRQGGFYGLHVDQMGATLELLINAQALCMSPTSRFGKLARIIASLIVGGLCIDGVSSVAGADNIAYMGTNTGDFGTIDLNTGVFSFIGTTSTIGHAQALAGMAEVNGVLYGAPVGNGGFYTINPTSGALTAVGGSGIIYDDLGYTTTGVYAVGQDANLYSINPATAAATLIGPTGIGFGTWRGLSTNSNTLYFADGLDLYTLNTTTGAATLIGALGDSIELGPMLQENGILYGGQETPSLAVDTVNPATGAATTGPGLTGTTGVFYALAPYPVQPVPAPLIGHGLAVVLAVGGVLFGAKLLERSRKRRSCGTAIRDAAA